MSHSSCASPWSPSYSYPSSSTSSSSFLLDPSSTSSLSRTSPGTSPVDRSPSLSFPSFSARRSSSRRSTHPVSRSRSLTTPAPFSFAAAAEAVQGFLEEIESVYHRRRHHKRLRREGRIADMRDGTSSLSSLAPVLNSRGRWGVTVWRYIDDETSLEAEEEDDEQDEEDVSFLHADRDKRFIHKELDEEYFMPTRAGKRRGDRSFSLLTSLSSRSVPSSLSSSLYGIFPQQDGTTRFSHLPAACKGDTFRSLVNSREGLFHSSDPLPTLSSLEKHRNHFMKSTKRTRRRPALVKVGEFGIPPSLKTRQLGESSSDNEENSQPASEVFTSGTVRTPQGAIRDDGGNISSSRATTATVPSTRTTSTGGEGRIEIANGSRLPPSRATEAPCLRGREETRLVDHLASGEGLVSSTGGNRRGSQGEVAYEGEGEAFTEETGRRSDGRRYAFRRNESSTTQERKTEEAALRGVGDIRRSLLGRQSDRGGSSRRDSGLCVPERGGDEEERGQHLENTNRLQGKNRLDTGRESRSSLSSNGMAILEPRNSRRRQEETDDRAGEVAPCIRPSLQDQHQEEEPPHLRDDAPTRHSSSHSRLSSHLVAYSLLHHSRDLTATTTDPSRHSQRLHHVDDFFSSTCHAARAGEVSPRPLGSAEMHRVEITGRSSGEREAISSTGPSSEGSGEAVLRQSHVDEGALRTTSRGRRDDHDEVHGGVEEESETELSLKDSYEETYLECDNASNLVQSADGRVVAYLSLPTELITVWEFPEPVSGDAGRYEERE